MKMYTVEELRGMTTKQLKAAKDRFYKYAGVRSHVDRVDAIAYLFRLKAERKLRKEQ